MGAAHEIKRRSRRMIVPIFGALFVCYFLIHAFHGDRGLFAWMHLQKEVAAAEATLADTRAIKDSLDGRIALLRSSHLDPDMLDERARVMSGLVRPDEIVLIDPAARAERATIAK
jgi:cell division protein FtsB